METPLVPRGLVFRLCFGELVVEGFLSAEVLLQTSFIGKKPEFSTTFLSSSP